VPTCTGLARLIVVPSPSWPAQLPPQPQMVPSLFSARVCQPPAAMAVTPVRPVTCTGVVRLVVVPSPSWPWSFAPQAHTVPSLFTAKLDQLPPASALTVNTDLKLALPRFL